MTAILNAEGISFSYSNGLEIFSDWDLSLDRKVYGLVGPNGVGKSTLARVLAGNLAPNQGVIRRSSELTYFPQREESPPVSVGEHLGPEYGWTALGADFLKEISLDSFCSTLSGGEWMRVRLARALSSQFLILDEPTNDLDQEGRQAVLKFLGSQSEGALLITHDRECLEFCDEILEFSNQGLSQYGFGWTDYQQKKAEERAGLTHSLEVARKVRTATRTARQELTARQEKRSRRGKRLAAKGGMPKSLIGARKRRAQSTSGRIEAQTLDRMEKAVSATYKALSALKVDPVMYAHLQGKAVPSRKLIAKASGFNLYFREWLYREDLNFTWRGSLRLALRGANGSGKTTLLKSLLGKESAGRGQLQCGGLKVLYIDQKCAELDDDKTVFENVRRGTKSESEVRSGLAQFLFPNEDAFKRVGDLSGGERLRAALAKGFLSEEQPELLLLDEPTNNLDLTNIEFLEKLVRSFRGAIIVISHDEVFLQNCGVTEEFNI